MNIIEIKEPSEELRPKLKFWEQMDRDGVMVTTNLNPKDFENIEIVCKDYGNRNMSLFFCYDKGKRSQGILYIGEIY